MSRVLLIILDGWGLGSDPSRSAIAQAETPFMDRCQQDELHSELITSGEQVGLPRGQMGNSEVGHTHIGAGRVIDQELLRINKEIASGRLYKHEKLRKLFSEVKRGQNVHFMGLFSGGGVHSQVHHLEALCKVAQEAGLSRTHIHAFMDGRDTPPYGGADLLSEMRPRLSALGAEIATCMGRYYAMDRDHRWARTQKAYEAMVLGQGNPCSDLPSVLKKAYQKGQSDEFLLPQLLLDAEGNPFPRLKEGDLLISFNFRPDRMRQLVAALTQKDRSIPDMSPLAIRCATMTSYDVRFNGIEVLYESKNLKHTLGEVLSRSAKRQLRIAETEKYPHVTFFFSGGQEEPFEGEERIICPSPQVATYDLEPEMSALALTHRLLPLLKTQAFDFVCLNFANPDMVGHTGILEAAIRGCSCVDRCAESLTAAALASKYDVLIIADHGNAEYMRRADGTPHTSHTTNPVPCVLIPSPGRRCSSLRNGTLIDVAPTVLSLMDLSIPKEMSGRPLYV